MEASSTSSPFSSAVKHFDPSHARVLVVGPMAAGKTTLVRALCRGDERYRHQDHGRSDRSPGGVNFVAGGDGSRPPAPTVGCNVDVKLLAGRPPIQRSVEFWDIGGNPDAALARGMFYEASTVAGVLLVYDVSNRRSLREMRGWVDEIDSAGISIIPRNGQGATDTQRNFEYSGRDDGRHESEMAILDELEGGGPKAAVEGRVPLLVVGNKEDLHGHSNHSGDGSAFAAELSAGYVTLSAKRLDDTEPFDRFFSAVFEFHSGEQASGFAQERSGYDSRPEWNTTGKYHHHRKHVRTPDNDDNSSNILHSGDDTSTPWLQDGEFSLSVGRRGVHVSEGLGYRAAAPAPLNGREVDGSGGVRHARAGAGDLSSPSGRLRGKMS